MWSNAVLVVLPEISLKELTLTLILNLTLNLIPKQIILVMTARRKTTS